MKIVFIAIAVFLAALYVGANILAAFVYSMASDLNQLSPILEALK